MSDNSAITIPKTKRIKILAESKSELLKAGQNISPEELANRFTEAEVIMDIIVSEMIGSKNKYLIEYAKENGYNNK
jgi:hypothetical protein